jgi:hypothetical protein
MKGRTAVVALLFVLLGTAGRPALADVVISYNEYSASPTIGRGSGTSTDPNQPGYGAMRIFIQKVTDYTGALPGGQKVTFQPDRATGRATNALRAGVQFANQGAQPKPIVSEPSWGFAYNSVPFGMSFPQMLEFLYVAKVDELGAKRHTARAGAARRTRRHAGRVPGRGKHHPGLRILPASDRQADVPRRR